jgi:menaquinone-dependent protoporphyrinogen oxidase
MRVLVVYGSKRHGTEGIARVVAETLREAGLATDLMSATDADDVREYDAVVVGVVQRLRAGDRSRYFRRRRTGCASAPVWPHQ